MLNLEHPHIGNPQPTCMCIDCREWRNRYMHTSETLTAEADIHLFNIFTKGPMKGTGFIVIDPRNVHLEEHATLDEANDEAAFIASKSGKAVIYVALATIRPDIQSKARLTSGDILKQVQHLVTGHAAPVQHRLAAPEDAEVQEMDKYMTEARKEVDAIAPDSETSTTQDGATNRG